MFIDVALFGSYFVLVIILDVLDTIVWVVPVPDSGEVPNLFEFKLLLYFFWIIFSKALSAFVFVDIFSDIFFEMDNLNYFHFYL